MENWHSNDSDFNFDKEYAKAKAQAPEPFTLQNRSIIDFLDIGIDPETNLLGNRWLTREGSLFIVAPSGHGKSSFCIQCMVHWAIGRAAFGFKPSRPLRILLLESEDDDAELKSFAQVLRTMKLSESNWELLHANTRIEFRRDLTGNRFFDAADQFLTQFPCDIFMVNPLTGFCTDQLTDEAKMADFLRTRLNALMVKHHCAPIIVAHMPKTQVAGLADKEWYEWMYSLSGCVTLTNWARAILVFVPSKIRGTYRFITAKRPAQSGWIQPEYYFAHSKKSLEVNDETFDIIEWVPASEAQIKEAAPPEKQRKIHPTMELIHSNMSQLEDYSRESWRTWLKESFNVGRHCADDFRAAMVQNGLIEEISEGQFHQKLFRKFTPCSKT
jgi:hypothetical protein